MCVLVGCGASPSGVPAPAPPPGTTPGAPGNPAGPPPAGDNACGSDAAKTGDPLVAQTRTGAVRGVGAGDTTAYLGIRYAQSTAGPNRFRPPQAPACNDAVADATRYGNVCPQILPSGSRLGDEDCLFLNVWTPRAGASPSPRPVLVFIHGGAYILGSGSQDLIFDGSGNLYAGQTLAEQHDAVVVTFNYRLGGLGFLAHPALGQEDAHGSSGNYGILDQIAALTWVRDNIAAFGGDPSRVTIFGESAGGLSVCLLLATPLARGLFAAAIMESGGCNVADRASRYDQGSAVAKNLSCDGAADVAACLRRQPAYSFVAELPQDFVQLLFNQDVRRAWEMPSGPNIDGYVFLEKPMATLAAGRHAKVPLIVGSNAEEFQIFTPALASCFDYENLIQTLFQSNGGAVLAHYDCGAYPSPRDAAIAVGTDFMFTCPARRVLRAAKRGGTAIASRYFFTHRYASAPFDALQSFHASELSFVFQTFGVLKYAPTAGDLEVANAIDGYWAGLAGAGDPNHAGAMRWPRYDAALDPAMVFDSPLATTTGVRSARCDFWDTISPDE